LACARKIPRVFLPASCAKACRATFIGSGGSRAGGHFHRFGGVPPARLGDPRPARPQPGSDLPLREQLGKDFYDKLEISDVEKEALMSGHLRPTGQSLVESLYLDRSW
jgi:hypothetical protein